MTSRSDMFLRIMARQTKAFIEADPIVVELLRPAAGAVADGAGGRLTTQNMVRVPPQRCRYVPSRTRSASQVFFTPEGQIISTRDATLVGYPDMDLRLNDVLEWQDQAFQVTFIYSDRRWQTQAQLDLMGEHTFRESV